MKLLDILLGKLVDKATVKLDGKTAFLAIALLGLVLWVLTKPDEPEPDTDEPVQKGPDSGKATISDAG